MIVRFVCIYEGWAGFYSVAFLPRIDEDVTFPGKTGSYLVTSVKHEVVKVNNVRRDEPDVQVYVRPRKIGQDHPNFRELVKEPVGDNSNTESLMDKIRTAKASKTEKQFEEPLSYSVHPGHLREAWAQGVDVEAVVRKQLSKYND